MAGVLERDYNEVAEGHGDHQEEERVAKKSKHQVANPGASASNEPLARAPETPPKCAPIDSQTPLANESVTVDVPIVDWPCDINENRVKEILVEFLQGKDLDQITLTQVLNELERKLGLSKGSLFEDPYKQQVKDLTADEVTRLHDEENAKAPVTVAAVNISEMALTAAVIYFVRQQDPHQIRLKQVRQTIERQLRLPEGSLSQKPHKQLVKYVILRYLEEEYEEALVTVDPPNPISPYNVQDDCLQGCIDYFLSGRRLSRTTQEEVRQDLEQRLGLSMGSLSEEPHNTRVRDLTTATVNRLLAETHALSPTAPTPMNGSSLAVTVSALAPRPRLRWRAMMLQS